MSDERPVWQFEEGDPLPEEYKKLLLKMLEHEGERAGNKSFLKFLQRVLEATEAFAPNEEAKVIMANYAAEEMKHCIMFHRLAMGIDKHFATRDTPFKHYAFHLPIECWADECFFHFFIDLNGAFHAIDWRESSYLPLRRMAPTFERDEFGHSEMGYRFLQEICNERQGKEQVQRLLYKWYPAALDTFGRSDSPNSPRFIYWGLKRMTNEELRQQYKKYVDAKLEALGLDIPDEKYNRKFL